MKIKITYTNFNTTVQRNVAKVYKVIPFGIPSGITADIFTQKGSVIVGTGTSTYTEFAPGSAGQYLTPDSSTSSGLKWETPSISISDPTNYLINGGFPYAQRQTPGTLTSINDNKYSADRWRITRENADLQYQRNDATGETGLTSQYYGRFKKITNAGKFMVCQIIEGANSVPLRGKTVNFQIKMKASSSKTIRVAIMELQNAGTIDTIPASIVTSWNIDGTDPTFGSNLAVISAAQSKSVTTSWQNFNVSVTIPSNSKNIICAIWSNADFPINDTLDMAEAGLFIGSSFIAWTPRLMKLEKELCEWFCEAIPTSGYIANGQVSSATAGYFYYKYNAPKRSTVSLTVTATDFSALNSTGSTLYNFSALSIYDQNDRGAFMQFTSATGLNAGDATSITRAASNPAYYECEL